MIWLWLAIVALGAWALVHVVGWVTEPVRPEDEQGSLPVDDAIREYMEYRRGLSPWRRLMNDVWRSF